MSRRRAKIMAPMDALGVGDVQEKARGEKTRGEKAHHEKGEPRRRTAEREPRQRAVERGPQRQTAGREPQRRTAGREPRPGRQGRRAGEHPRVPRWRRVPLAAWVCAAVAVVNAACWSVISAPFQTPDEPSHFAYVQHLAQTGHLPSSDGEEFPPAEQLAMLDLQQTKVRFSQENKTISSEAQQRVLEKGLAEPLSRSEPGDAGVAASQPPLYYALETVPYALGSGGTLLDRLALMRLLSTLFAGLTALFAFGFLRELLPAVPWAWTVGGLGVALQPTLAMMSGAVNPDALLFAVSGALFYLLARAFGRGLDRRLALALGAVIACGTLTKLTFIGLLPGAVVGVVVLSVRAARERGVAVHRLLAPALALAAVPVGIYLLADALSGKLTLVVLSGAAKGAAHHGTVGGAIAYIWQLYLPRLPGMHPLFHSFSGSRLWFEQLVGRYGWLDTTFPSWAVRVALIPFAAVVALFVRELIGSGRALRARAVEGCVYLLMVVGLMTIIGVDEYAHRVPGEYTQLRYLLPAVALLGAVLALAARGAGRKWGPVAGTLIVLVVLAHDLFSQLLTISRFYG
jgi:hypothetical protein